MKAAGNELVTVGVDQVSRNVFPDRRSGVTAQFPILQISAVARCFMVDGNGPGIQSVSGQEALRCEDTVRVGVIKTFGLAGASPGLTFELLDQALASRAKRLLIEIQRTFVGCDFAQPFQLSPRPEKTIKQSANDSLQRLSKAIYRFPDAFFADDPEVIALATPV